MRGVFAGLGYGRKLKQFIFDADIGIDYYEYYYFSTDRSIQYASNYTGYYRIEQGYNYVPDDLQGSYLGIRFGLNAAFRVFPKTYIKVGGLYRQDLFDQELSGYSMSSYSCSLSHIKSYMINIGLSLSIR